ncbi:hypothetical protein [Nocardiopsis baichengensis]|uniref:hypothetical protein n=1 Tax=Nocardiopsis baichengensis TaxID=280240 RepID=UPI00034DA668|nr:hypothetical protein [Nocardiopsis baichengensis]
MESTPNPTCQGSPSDEPGGIYTICRRFKLDHPGWNLDHDPSAPDYRAFVATRAIPLTEEERAAGLQDTIKAESPVAAAALVRVERSEKDLRAQGNAAPAGGVA